MGKVDENKYNDIKEIIEKYKYSREFSFYSTRYKKEIGDLFYGSIKNNDDVEKIKQNVENIINYFKSFKYRLAQEDIKSMELELGKYEIAMRKVIQCYEICDFNYSPDKLIEFINNLDKYEKGIADVRMRLCCQD
ncbi:hypothetical protein NNC19_04995 [Clostridium sp. SHJSY1]|uniref:hypothetical protein n=1 Tax=Clostridium sp. SHJSY1 TaxID=2942483 RepID=UPI0028742D54|nr:hypothetical protein [Clostridium sp. SHJSY1]MDS0525029.1 hypothetical protein [Clostridium sp. SHJSY1]